MSHGDLLEAEVLFDLMMHFLKAPGTETLYIQEEHFPIYHALCSMIEAYYFTEAPPKPVTVGPRVGCDYPGSAEGTATVWRERSRRSGVKLV
jgi:hypothetical protein